MSANLQLDLPAAPSLKVPSIIHGQSWDEYRAIDAVNFSTLKVLDHSAKHYRHNLAHPTETDTLRLGTAAHCAVLEPTKFRSRFAVWRERKANGDSAARKGPAWESFVAEHAGRTIITEDQETDALLMQSAISSSSDAMFYLSHGSAEVTLLWRIGKRPCKGRVDFITDLGNGPVLVGVKTAVDIRPKPFGRAATRLLYGLQWPFYFDGYEAATGVRPAEIVEIVVEKKEPHDVIVYGIEEEELDIGRADYLALLERLDECESADSWPGVANGARKIPFKFPQFKYESEDDLADTGIQW